MQIGPPPFSTGGTPGAANASLVHGSQDNDVLRSIEPILAPEHTADAASAYWSDGHHRLIDIVARIRCTGTPRRISTCHVRRTGQLQ